MKQNEKIRKENEELKAKCEKTLEILDTYKQNSEMPSTWKDWNKHPSEYPINQSNLTNNSCNITPEPDRIVSVPYSPIKEVKDTASVSVQTVCDKQIQAFEETSSRKISGFIENGEKKEIPKSKVVTEFKNLANDIFTLSESVRSLNSSNFRASQTLAKKKEGEISMKNQETCIADDEKMRKLLERSEVNNKRAEIFKKENNFIETYTTEFPLLEDNLRKRPTPSSFDTSFNHKSSINSNLRTPDLEPKHNYAMKPIKPKEIPEIIVLDKEFYDDNLFQIVDDLERIEEEKINGPPNKTNERDFGDYSEMSYSSFSNYSSKQENSFDSFEALRKRAHQFKQTIKY